jgi:hypothetical protein
MATQGVYTFRILGQLCHLLGSLLPSPDERARFSQIYIYTSDLGQIEHRMSLFSDDVLNYDIVAALQAMARDHNPYYRIWKTARDRLLQNPDILTIRLRTINTPTPHDQRHYNHPTADEIAVIMPGTGDTDGAEARDIIIQQRDSDALQRFSELHPSYFPCVIRYCFPTVSMVGICVSFRYLSRSPISTSNLN